MAYNLIISNLSYLHCNALCQATAKCGVTISTFVFVSETITRCSVFLFFTGLFLTIKQFKLGTALNFFTWSKHKPLHDAVRSNRAENVEKLLKKGTDVNVQNRIGETALHIAAGIGNLEIVQLLLQFRADPNIEEKHGETALHISCRRQNNDITQALLDCGADVDIQNHYGETPLHIAVNYENEEIVDVLLAISARPDIQDSCGNTVLHSSVKKRNKQIVISLLEYGADITIANDEKQTATDTAVHNGKSDMVRLLVPYYVLRKSQNKCGGEILNSVCEDKELTKFQSDCEEELKSIKESTVCDSRASFYDFLTKGTRQMEKYARNDCFMNVLDSENSTETFPIYIDLMRRNFMKGFQRKLLAEKCYSLFFKKVKYHLPITCIEEIFSYFNDKELINFVSSQIM